MPGCAHGVMNKQIVIWMNGHRSNHRDSFWRFVQNYPNKKNSSIPICTRADKHIFARCITERSFSKKLNKLKLTLIPWLHFSNNVHCIKGRPLIDFYWFLWIWSKRDRTLINFYVLIKDRTLRKIMRVIIIKVKIILSQRIEDKLWRVLVDKVILAELDGGSMSARCDYSCHCLSVSS